MQPINSRRYGLSIGTDPYQELTADIQLQRWKADQALIIDTRRATIRFNVNSSTITISPQFRSITLLTRPEAPRDSFSLNSHDIGLGYIYNGFDLWTLGVEWQKSDYSKNIELDQIRPIVLFYLQPSALSLSSGLEKSHRSFSVTRLFETSQVNLSYVLSNSAIDGSEQRTVSLEWQKSLNPETSISLSAGKSEDVTNHKTSDFYTLILSYYFY